MITHKQALVAALLLTLAGTSGAQQRVAGPRFQGWVGCWTGAPGNEVLLPVIAAPTLVCITPTSDENVVDVSTIADGKVVSTHKLDASGRERPLEAKGCTGVQSASWSADERRIYLKSAAQCGGLPRTMSGILSISPKGEWLDVQQVSAGGAENMRVMRYRDAGIPTSVPTEIADALNGRSIATQGARLAAGATIGQSAVLEASRLAAPAVVEAWLLERAQPFALDAKELIALADAGVSPRITDAMVAVSNPQEFAVAHNDVAAQPLADTTVVGRRLHVYLDRNDPWSWGYDPYGYNSYGYRRGLYDGYGYNSYGSAYGGYGYGYGAPVIVVTRPETAAPHGRRVKGEGYQPPAQTGSSTSRGAVDRNTGSSSSSSGSSSTSSSSGSSSSGSSQPAPSSTRTAQPKP
jgi:hypothetical protein